MDGFVTNSDIMVSGVTNRSEVLAQILLRHGCFGRNIMKHEGMAKKSNNNVNFG